MENGVKEVKTFEDVKDVNVVPGPRINGKTEKTKRGTASHKTERINGRFDLEKLAFQHK